MSLEGTVVPNRGEQGEEVVTRVRLILYDVCPAEAAYTASTVINICTHTMLYLCCCSATD